MRLWHYKLIPFLPKSQLLAQWRELNSIFKNKPKHILINYVYEYPKENLKFYSLLVMVEMKERHIKCKTDGFKEYFGYVDGLCPEKGQEQINKMIAENPFPTNPFPKHHDFIYLRECFYNLEEKYNRGQKDFDFQTYNALFELYQGEVDKHFKSIL